MPSLTDHALQLLRLGVVILGPVPLCLWLLHREGKGRPAHLLLLFLGAWVTLQVAVGLALGISGRLGLRAVLAAECVLLAAGGVLYGRAGAPNPWAGWRDEWDLARADDRGAAAVLCVLAVLALAVARKLILTVPWDWDTIWYHVPTMAQWHLDGALTVPGVDYVTATYPHNWQVLCGLMVYPFGDDWLIFAPNLVAWAVLGLSIYGTARIMGATRTASAAAATLALTLPLVQSNLSTMHVDLPLAACFMCGYYLAMRFHHSRRPHHLGVLLVCLGMLAGIKTPGLVYGGLLLAMLAVLEGVRALRRGRLGLRRACRAAAVPAGLGALMACGLCGFWYLRNLLVSGNPLGVVEIAVAGRVLFAGALSGKALRYTTLLVVFDVTRADHWRLALDALRAQGGWHLPGLALLAATWPLAALRRRPLGPWAWLTLISLAVALLVHLATPHTATSDPTYDGAITPWFAQAFRYGIPVVGLLGVAAAVGASRMGLHPAVSAGAALAAGAALPAPAAMPAPTALQHGLVVALGLAIYLLGPAVAATRRPPAPRHRAALPRLVAAALACALLAPLILATYGARQDHASLRNQVFRGIPAYIQQHTAPGDTIGSAMNVFSYPLHGTGMDRRVAYWDNTTAQRVDSVDDLVDWLRREGATHLGVGPLQIHPSGPEVQAWLQAEDSPFEHVAGSDPWGWVALYRLRDGWAGEGGRAPAG